MADNQTYFVRIFLRCSGLRNTPTDIQLDDLRRDLESLVTVVLLKRFVFIAVDRMDVTILIPPTFLTNAGP